MKCLHPSCPMGGGLSTWEAVLSDPTFGINENERSRLLPIFESFGGDFGVARPLPITNAALKKRLFDACPCLFSQVTERVTAAAVVHFCEITLRERITSTNVCAAFDIQHPKKPDTPYLYKPLAEGAGGGDIMEALCSEVLTNEGIPHMVLNEDGWPEWASPAHVSLNKGKFSKIKMYGDILIPAAPTNILISVKSEKARERLLVSGNRFESVGFGFFDEPSEFWSETRINLYKRMGFTAIYMPGPTLSAIAEYLSARKALDYAININGTQLYRDISNFGSEMKSIAGRITLDL